MDELHLQAVEGQPLSLGLTASRCDVIFAAPKKLHALLTSMTGDGFDTFSSLNDSLQHDLLWLADGLAGEIVKALKGEVNHG